jgi:tetratricopeptide (TPR) repeat protein
VIAARPWILQGAADTEWASGGRLIPLEGPAKFQPPGLSLRIWYHTQSMTLINSLLGKPRRARAHFAANVAKYHDPTLVRSLLDMSWELRFENPAEMLHLAHLATVIAPHCKSEDRERLDLLGEAWTHFANALKVRGVLRVSGNAFKKAERFLEHTQCQALRASYLECYAALRLRQMRLSETRSALIEALEIREQAGEPGAIALTLNQLAVSESESGSYITALQHLSRANRLITWESDPRMFLLSRHNSIYVLRAMGRPVEALGLYERLQPVYATAGDRVQRLRGQWLFAKIAASFGRGSSDETAERAFRATARAAIELQLPYESGKVLFELGSFFASRRRWHQLELVMVEALNLLDHLGISRDSGLARVLLLVGRDRARSQALLSRAGTLLIRHHFAAAA